MHGTVTAALRARKEELSCMAGTSGTQMGSGHAQTGAMDYELAFLAQTASEPSMAVDVHNAQIVNIAIMVPLVVIEYLCSNKVASTK